MSLITDNTKLKLKLLNNLANTPTANADDLLFIQRSLKSYNMKYDDLVSGLPDNSTLEVDDDNNLRIKPSGVTESEIANNAVTLGKLSQIADNYQLLGNVSGTNQNVGLVEIDDEVTSAPDKVVSSAGIQNAISTSITGSLSENGYQIFPSGLIMQWGILYSVPYNTIQTESFNIEFPTICVYGNFSYAEIYSDPQSAGHFKILDNTQFQVTNTGVETRDMRWFAIGY